MYAFELHKLHITELHRRAEQERLVLEAGRARRDARRAAGTPGARRPRGR
ncbi:hypothetical protein [Streptomyces sp. NPDC006510]